MRYIGVTGVYSFFSSRRRHTRYWRDWSSDVFSSDLPGQPRLGLAEDLEDGAALAPFEVRRFGRGQDCIDAAEYAVARRGWKGLELLAVDEGAAAVSEQ